MNEGSGCGKSAGAGKGSKPSDGKSKKKKKWYNWNPDNLKQRRIMARLTIGTLIATLVVAGGSLTKKRLVCIGASKLRRILVPMIRTMLD